MNWQSPADFFAMGGYALYVWGSFGACALALALESVLVGRRHAGMLRSLHRQLLADRLEREFP